MKGGSGTTRNRTGDTRIFSPLLYQLSYGTFSSLFAVAKVYIFFHITKLFPEKIRQFIKNHYLCVHKTQVNRDVAQLVAHYVRDVGVGRSSRLIPTIQPQRSMQQCSFFDVLARRPIVKAPCSPFLCTSMMQPSQHILHPTTRHPHLNLHALRTKCCHFGSCLFLRYIVKCPPNCKLLIPKTPHTGFLEIALLPQK